MSVDCQELETSVRACVFFGQRLKSKLEDTMMIGPRVTSETSERVPVGREGGSAD